MDVTVTLALALADPPAPVHVMLYVVLDAGLTEAEPDVPEALKPLPVQLVVLVEDHVSVDVWPGVIDEGDALSDTDGVGKVFPAAPSHTN